jgi:hypothetical protein
VLTTTWRIALTASLASGMALAGAGVASAAPPANAGKPLATTLQPQQEVAPFVGVTGASGRADLRLNSGQQRICVDLTTSGFDLVLAHIHEGEAGTNGGVVVDFTDLIEGNRAAGCVAVPRDLVKEIRKNPADYYVNTHQGLPGTDGFFQGVRGQLG